MDVIGHDALSEKIKAATIKYRKVSSMIAAALSLAKIQPVVEASRCTSIFCRAALEGKPSHSSMMPLGNEFKVRKTTCWAAP
jgi:hypothetical protein